MKVMVSIKEAKKLQYTFTYTFLGKFNNPVKIEYTSRPLKKYTTSKTRVEQLATQHELPHSNKSLVLCSHELLLSVFLSFFPSIQIQLDLANRKNFPISLTRMVNSGEK
jgi:hypothetical protein